MASRHLSRSIAMQSLYEWDFYGKKPEDLNKIVEKNIKEFGTGLKNSKFIWKLVEGVVDNLPKIDKIIEKAAPEWPIDQITIVDRNVLRIGLYELLYENKEEVPPKVAINEAIELAKSFGGENSGKFINGVLGTVFKEIPGLEKASVSLKSTEMIEEILTAAVVFCKKDDAYQIVLIRDIFGYWTFPKGHVEKGESLNQAIIREIGEEVGLKQVKIVKKLGEREYIAKDPKEGRIRRKVTDFLVEVFGSAELKVEKSSGIKDAKWFDLDEILELKRYKDAEKTLLQAIDYLKGTIKNKATDK